jgi:hypothetical protein
MRSKAEVERHHDMVRVGADVHCADIRAEIYLGGTKAKSYFRQLEEQKEEIERELGYKLDWEELPEGKQSRIAIYLDDADPTNRADWPRQHEWLAKKINELHKVFAARLSAPYAL